MKPCRGCGRDLPRSAFYRHRGKSDGLQARCKECQKKAVAEHDAERRAAGKRTGKWRVEWLWMHPEDRQRERVDLPDRSRCCDCGVPISVEAVRCVLCHRAHRRETARPRLDRSRQMVTAGAHAHLVRPGRPDVPEVIRRGNP